MGSWRCQPGSLKESLLFAAGSALTTFPVLMYASYWSIPPAHRTAGMLRADITVALGVAGGVGLAGGLVFGLAQAWRRRQDRLLPRSLGAWLPLALGGVHVALFLAGLGLCQWLFSLEDVTLTLPTLALGIPTALSRLAWRDTGRDRIGTWISRR